MKSINPRPKMSKQNRLFVSVLISSIAVVFALVGILLYINYYAKVQVILTNITRYKDGEIKNVTEYNIINIKKGRNISSLPSPYMDGYVFSGWYLDNECQVPFDYSRELKENLQVYGKFDLIEYSIELVLDNDLVIDYNATNLFDYTTPYTIEDIIYLPNVDDTLVLRDGSETTLNEYKTLNKEGYVFAGWGTMPNIVNVNGYSTVMPSGDTTFYAVWKPITTTLQYVSQDLSFANSINGISTISDRLNDDTFGLNYNNGEYILESEEYKYGDELETQLYVSDPSENFEFEGWYLDKDFKYKVNFGQLYIKNGYLTLTKEQNKNIVLDTDYLGNIPVPSDEELEKINSYSSTDENNSYIKLFAKWSPKYYTIIYDLNLPTTQTYASASSLRPILNPNIPDKIYSSQNNVIRRKINVYQGWKLNTTLDGDGVLYNIDYFKNVLYRDDDFTGLPAYNIVGWNSESNGQGYDATNTSDIYFNKNNFNIINGTITIYAQWSAYNRLNYYYVTSDNSQSYLLSTVNIENNQVSIADLKDMVLSYDIENNQIYFTDYQIAHNSNLKPSLSMPNNKTFLGWSTDKSYKINENYLYPSGITIPVGQNVEEGHGIRAGSVSLYSVWIQDTNYVKYDFGDATNIEFDENFFDSDELKSNVTSGQVFYQNRSLRTIASDKYLARYVNGNDTYSLTGWELTDDSKISGTTTTSFTFEPANTKVLTDKFTVVDTKLKSGSDTLKINSYSHKVLTIYADWIKNFTISFYKGASDAIWSSGYTDADDKLTLSSGGSVRLTMPSIATESGNILNRPYYTFVGWCTENREDVSDPSLKNYDNFISANEIYLANQSYLNFTTDTVLYAVWEPILYVANIYQNKFGSPYNYTAARIYIAKENTNVKQMFATSEITLNGSTVSYLDGSQLNKVVQLTTSAAAGYGLNGWNYNNVELAKNNSTGYVIGINSSNSSLFNEYPTNEQKYLSIFPEFGILKYSVNFVISNDEGIRTSYTKLKTDIDYNTPLKTVLSSFYSDLNTDKHLSGPEYEEGYRYLGWNISGDVDNAGVTRSDYLLDIRISNLTVRSDMEVTLKADKNKYAVRFIFNNPDTSRIAGIYTYNMSHNDELNTKYQEMTSLLNSNYSYTGYNFKNWVIESPTSTTSKDNFDDTLVKSSLTVYPVYEEAKVIINYIYESLDSLNADKIETYSVNSTYKSTILVYTADMPKKPSKTGKVFDAWTTTNNLSFNELDRIEFASASIRNILEQTIENGKTVYVLNLTASFASAVTLTLDLTGVTLYSSQFYDTVYTYKQGTNLYFGSLPISELDGSKITPTNNRGIYRGDWITLNSSGEVDENSVTYNIYSSNSYIPLNSNVVLKPIFEPKVYVVKYYYVFNNNEVLLTEQNIKDDFATVPTLFDAPTINTAILRVNALKNYRADVYYLTREAFDNKINNSQYKYQLGVQFNVVNKRSQAINDTFSMYIELKSVSVINYNYDELNSVVIDLNTNYIIGTSSQLLNNPDIYPSLRGYDFVGWATTKNATSVEYNNGDVIYFTGQITNLYPVWNAMTVTINYYDADNNFIESDLTHKYNESILLKSDLSDSSVRLLGWSKLRNNTVQFALTTMVSLDNANDDMILNLFAVTKKLYTIYYSNSIGQEVKSDLTIVEGETVTLAKFDNLSLSEKPGSEFTGWYLDNDGEAFTTFAINSRTGNTIYYSGGNTTLSSLAPYELHFVANWETEKYYIRFTYKDSSGNDIVNYGHIEDLSIDNNATPYEYDEHNIFEFTFPVALNYSKDGHTYLFSHWLDNVGNIPYNSASIQVSLNKNYDLVAVYTEQFTLTFNYLSSTYSADVLAGNTYVFNNDEDLKSFVEDINSKLTLEEVVGFEQSGWYYSFSADNDPLKTKTKSFSTDIEVRSNLTFNIVTVKLFKLVIYQNISYDDNNNTFNYTNDTTIDKFILDDYIDLSRYNILSTGYRLAGFVLTDNDNYQYNLDATNLLNGQVQLNNTNVTANTMYLYPVIEVKYDYYIYETSENLYTTKYFRLGSYAEDIDVDMQGLFLLDWVDRYNTTVTYDFDTLVLTPFDLLAYTSPYFSVQVPTNGIMTDSNCFSLFQGDLTFETEIGLPKESDIVLKSQYVGIYEFDGWYISYNGNRLSLNGTPTVFAGGRNITIGELNNEYGLNLKGFVSVYSFDLIPKWLNHGDVTLNGTLSYFNGSVAIDLTSSNYNNYAFIGGFDSIEKYAFTSTVRNNDYTSFDLILNRGYEIKNSNELNISKNGNKYSITTYVDGATTINVVIKKSSSFDVLFKVDSSNINNFDESKINTATLSLFAGNDKVLEENLFDLDGKALLKLDTNSSISANVNFVSPYYYLDSISIFSDSDSEVIFNASSTDPYLITGAPTITVTLKERTYNVVFDSNIIDSGVTSDSILIRLPNATKDNYELQGFRILAESTFMGFVSDDTIVNITSVSGQNEVTNINLEPVYTPLNKTLTFDYDSNSVQLLDQGNKTIINQYSVPFDTTVQINNNIVTFKTGSYSVNGNGLIISNLQDITITVDALNTWEVTLNKQSDFKMEGDTSIVAEVTAGRVDVVTTLEYPVGSIYYDQGITLPVVIGDTSTTTGGTVELTYADNSNFIVSDIEINGTKLGDYDTIAEFNDATNLNLTKTNDNLKFDNVVDNLNIKYIIQRTKYNLKISLANQTEEINNAISNFDGSYILKLGSNTITNLSEITLGSFDYRQIVNYAVGLDDLGYFDIDKISYELNGITYDIYGGVYTDISSYNNNVLTLVSGEEDGSDITYYVTLKLKEYSIIFHRLNDTYPVVGDYSAFLGLTPDQTINYHYGDVVSLNASDYFVPNDVTNSSSVVFKFEKWQYYNGNYETDTTNQTKFQDLTGGSINMSNVYGNVHLFAKWNKYFDMEFVRDNVGSSSINNLPSKQSNLLIDSPIALSIPTATGYKFVGYSLTYGNAPYATLNYNVGFSITFNNGYQPIYTFNANDITLGQIVTSDMTSYDSAFKIIKLIPLWQADNAIVNINVDSSKGSIEKLVYDDGDYVIGNFNINYDDILTLTYITYNATNYKAIVVSNAMFIKGAIIVNANTLNFYEFDNFVVSGLGEDNRVESSVDISCEFIVTYVPYTINFNWDKTYLTYGDNYVIRANSDVKLAVYPADTGEVDLLSGDSISLSTQYDSITLYALRDSALDVEITLGNGYKYNNLKTINISVSPTDNHIARSQDCHIELDIISLEVNKYLDNVISNDMGVINISYFDAIKEDGVVVGYDTTLTSVSLNSVSDSINVIYGNKLIIEVVNNLYEITSILSSGNSVGYVENSTNYVDVIGFNSIDINVTQSLVKFTFQVDNTDYATAYFNVTGKNITSNELVSFVDIITNGYDLNKVYPNIIKNKSNEVTYYSSSELQSLYSYSVNENLATVSPLKQQLKNVWFDGWNISIAYPEEDNITENNMYVTSGIQEVIITARVKDAWLFNVNVNYEELNGDKADGGVMLTLPSGFNGYIFDGVMYNSAYSGLTLKVLDGTELPQFMASYGTHSYVASDDVVSKEIVTYKGYKFTSDTTVTNSIQPNENGQFDWTISWGLKKFTVALNVDDGNDRENSEFEKSISFDSITHSITFAELIDKAHLQYNYYLDDISKNYYYRLAGFYYADERVDISGNETQELNAYIENRYPNYQNGSSFSFTILYEKVSKQTKYLSIVTSDDMIKIPIYVVNGEIAGEMISSNDLEYMVAGEYRNLSIVNIDVAFFASSTVNNYYLKQDSDYVKQIYIGDVYNASNLLFGYSFSGDEMGKNDVIYRNIDSLTYSNFIQEVNDGVISRNSGDITSLTSQITNGLIDIGLSEMQISPTFGEYNYIYIVLVPKVTITINNYDISNNYIDTQTFETYMHAEITENMVRNTIVNKNNNFYRRAMDVSLSEDSYVYNYASISSAIADGDITINAYWDKIDAE